MAVDDPLAGAVTCDDTDLALDEVAHCSADDVYAVTGGDEDAGSVENGFVEILSGLNTGDRVVATGLNRIQPGSPVRVAGASPAAARTGAAK